MALKKTYVTNGNVSLVDALHYPHGYSVESSHALIKIGIYKDNTELVAGNMADSGQAIITDAADIQSYITDFHASKDAWTRLQDYLKEKVDFYSDAVIV
jgi:hypothetical protein